MEALLSQVNTQCTTPTSGVPPLDGIGANLFLTLLQVLVQKQCSLVPPPLPNYGPNLNDMDQFDFIVVGAGSAGSVVAHRLSENKDWNVLLLESGGEPTQSSHIPALMFSVMEGQDSWNYQTEEQSYSCKGFKDHRCRWFTGHVLGGSSSINGMMYVRGNRGDFDGWEKQGNPGWGYDDVLPYFKKSEDNQEFFNNTEIHGTDGPLKIGNYDHDEKITEVLAEAVQELGFPFVQDIHAGSPICYGTTQGNVHQGTRYGTYKAYLQTAQDRPNLKIATGAHVTKVIINSDTKQAMAVEFKIGDEIKQVRPLKEIILSAGALRTPQILMLSGVGPKNHLNDLKIKVIQDLKVGENLQDHLFLNNFIAKLPEYFDSDKHLLDDVYQFFTQRSGKLSTIGFTNFVGFINSLNQEYPDLQIMHAFYPKNDGYALPTMTHAITIADEIRKEILDANTRNSLLQFWVKLIQPKSTGRVELVSSNPFDTPKYISNYLKEDEDVETMLRGVHHVQRILKTKTFQKYNPELVNLKLTNCVEFEFNSDEYWRCSIRTLSTTIYHYAGTCKMGPKEDETAVVDSQLRVHGIDGLRVIDASVMPKIVSGNTNAATIMIGEKGADLIKEFWTKNELNKDEF